MLSSNNICLQGLNNVYSVTPMIYDYQSFNDYLLNKIETKIGKIEVKAVFLELNQNGANDIDSIEAEISGKLSSFQDTNILEILNSAEFYSEFSIIHYIKENLDDIRNKGFNLVIYNENLLSLYFEKKIIESLNLKGYFKFTNEAHLLKEVVISPKNYIILSDKISSLEKFIKEGCWTGVIVSFVLSGLELDGLLKELVNSNINLIKNGIKPSFSTTTFFQQTYLYELISKINNEFPSEKTSNLQKFNERVQSHLVVVTMVRTSFKYSDYKKHRFIFSNERVIFIPHVGGNEIQINGYFNVILNRIIYQEDFIKYSTLLQDMNTIAQQNKSIKIIDNLNNIEGFLQRDKMVALLTKFINLPDIQELNKKYNTKLIFPVSQYIPLSYLVDFNKISEFLKVNNINLPVIVKFQSDSREVCHQMLLIISENGLEKVGEFAKKFDIEKTFCVIQKFANHGGSVIKLYRYENSSSVYFRPSIPDMKSYYENTIEEFSKGYFAFRTEDLLSKKIFELWKKFENQVDVKELTSSKYLDEVSAVFEKEVDKTLFGLDFLYDHENKEYAIVDCNNFPGYKELEKVFWKHLSNHIIYYYGLDKK